MMTTIFAIGFGDIAPQTSAETILTIFIQFIGVCTNAYLLGTFVSRLIDAIGMRFLHQFYSFVDFLKFKGIKKEFLTEVHNYFEENWRTNHGTEDPNQVYKFIPETIRNHLKQDMCGYLLRRISLFNLASESFRKNLTKILKFAEFIPNETIIQQGELNSSILLLNVVFLDVFIDGTKFASVNCTDGVFFGEQEILVDLPRGSSVKAVTYVRGWKLEREDMQLEVGLKAEMKDEMLNVVKMLFPDFYKTVRRMLSQSVVESLMRHGEDDEEFDDDLGAALQDSSGSDGGD
jgi:CRP-like cAMP-binding protein